MDIEVAIDDELDGKTLKEMFGGPAGARTRELFDAALTKARDFLEVELANGRTSMSREEIVELREQVECALSILHAPGR